MINIKKGNIMNYLRTKDTVYQVVDQNNLVYRVKGKKDPLNIYSKSKKNTEIIASSDTIEELCDAYVVIRQGQKPLVLQNNATYSVSFNNTTIYGAIWTDKGLIYVAKMNEKGTLELL